MKLTFLSRKQLDKHVYLFSFKPSKPLLWKAGQHMNFKLKHSHPDNLGIERVFSIASAPFEGEIQILTKCDENCSSFKQALMNLKEGEVIEADEPTGDFVVADPKKEQVFVAAGVGIAPFRAILADLDYHNQPIHATLLYSHASKNFPFKEEIEELVERHTDFQVFYIVDPNQKERGRIKEVVSGLENFPIYMSGIYIRKIATMLGGPNAQPRRLVHDGKKTKPHNEENYLTSLLGE